MPRFVSKFIKKNISRGIEFLQYNTLSTEMQFGSRVHVNPLCKNTIQNVQKFWNKIRMYIWTFYVHTQVFWGKKNIFCVSWKN
jgi:hypothetical protein